MKKIIIFVFALALSIGVAACDGTPGTSLPGGETTVPGSETTSPPETTLPDTTIAASDTTIAASDTTIAASDTTIAEDTAEGATPWWLLIVIGLALLLLIVALVSRGSSKPVATTAAALTWKDHGRQGYADARWLYDAMSDDLAIWRGNAQYDGVTAVGATAGTGKAELWNELGLRLDSARSSLYALEAAAPDPQTAQTTQATINAMMAVRTALDSRADARAAYRVAEATAADSPQTLMDARDREVRASTNLNQARAEFARSLTSLSTVI